YIKRWSTSTPYEPIPHAAMKETLERGPGTACARVNAPRRIRLPRAEQPIARGESTATAVSGPSPLRRECAPETRPEYPQRAVKCRGGQGVTPWKVGSIFGQFGAVRAPSNTLRAGSEIGR